MDTVCNGRKTRAAELLSYARAVEINPAMNSIQLQQAVDNWIYFATKAEIKRNWKKSFGNMPGWI
jgi:hypothetical protein